MDEDTWYMTMQKVNNYLLVKHRTINRLLHAFTGYIYICIIFICNFFSLQYFQKFFSFLYYKQRKRQATQKNNFKRTKNGNPCFSLWSIFWPLEYTQKKKALLLFQKWDLHGDLQLSQAAKRKINPTVTFLTLFYHFHCLDFVGVLNISYLKLKFSYSKYKKKSSPNISYS